MEETGGISGQNQGFLSSSGQNQQPDVREVSHQLNIEGVLHFLQTEWMKLEQQRTQWELDRAELQGERRGQEALKQDLVRRIRMLEFALKQERAKQKGYNPSVLTGRDTNQTSAKENSVPGGVITPSERLAVEFAKTDECKMKMQQTKTRLQRFLMEMGYSDSMLDFKQYRMRQPFVAAVGSQKPRDPAEYYEEYDILPREKQSNTELKSDVKSDETPADVIDCQQAAKCLSENVKYFQSAPLGDLQNIVVDADSEEPATGDANTPFSENPSAKQNPKTLETIAVKFQCRGHFDAVRAVCFHALQPLLATASEDGTVMLWNTSAKSGSVSADLLDSSVVSLDPMFVYRGHSGPVLCLTAPGPNQSACVNASDQRIAFFSGGMDGKICSWCIPASTVDGSFEEVDIYSPYRPGTESGFVYQAGDSPVWAVCVHPSKPWLVGAQADGQISLFHLTDSMKSTEPVKRIHLDEAMRPLLAKEASPWKEKEVGRPTAAAFLPEDMVTRLPNKENLLLVCTSRGWLCLLNLESGEMLAILHPWAEGVAKPEGGAEAADDWSGVGVYSLAAHPTFATVVTGHEDNCVRMFDLDVVATSLTDPETPASKALVETIPMHEAPVTGLAIDAMGLYLYTASHDGWVRIFDLESKTVTFETLAHRKKADEAINGICINRKQMQIAVAGADSVCKVFVDSHSYFS